MNKDELEREQRLLAYLRGDMGEEEVKRLEADIAKDEEYAQRLERLLLGEETEAKSLESISDEKQRAIVRRGKWRNRFSNTAFTVAILFCSGVLLVFVNSWVGLLVYDDLFRVAKSMVNFTQPALSVGSTVTQGSLVNTSISMELRESIGAEQENVGRFESDNWLGFVSAKPQWTNGVREKKLFFRYPTAMEDTLYLREPAWTTMEKLPEGTVSQLAISFDSFLTYEQYYDLVSRHVYAYNQETTWFAVDTGVENKYREHEDGNLLLGAGDVWGFSERELNYGEAAIRVNGEGDRRMAAFMNEMKYLSEQKRLTRKIGTSLLASSDTQITERYNYMQQNGVRIYGAVLTGPTKELLKLKAEKSITAAFLGKVDWWNWERPAAIGAQNSY